ncbi:hypothetical protein [Bacteroides sp. 51]|uniref:hypothetical protein n=1 Tax=Bacteroides sp. 51 TaxID=2302938 RepID=UPI0013D42636|nr:hypothetical protein [Bacteroides sp. 51]NDV84257.1 hypothetical protein [Bacteroides sp. 51]
MRYIILIFIALWATNFQAQTLSQKEKEKQQEDSLVMKTRVGVLSFEDAYTPPPPSVVPPSPQAAIFNKYLNHEISDYNGLPQIEIPLYEIEIKGLKIPITLSYHAGGIKYLQYDGDIGAGWSINAGGYGITRTIKGKDDSSVPFYNEQDFNQKVINRSEGMKSYVGYNLALSVDGASGFYGDCLYNDNQQLTDGEYDQFNYMTPSGSGQFIIANRDHINTRNVVNTNPENQILLAATSALSLNDMAVVDGNGFTYYMGKHPTQSGIHEEGPLNRYDNRTGWPLRQIKSPYNETIEFSYVTHNVSHDREDIFWDDYYTFNISEAMNDTGSDQTFEASYNFNDTFYGAYGSPYKTYFVSEIRTGKEIIEFMRYTPQAGMPYVIKEIRIKTLAGSLVKTIKLDYNNSGLHRLLSKLTIGDEVYSFDYYPTPDPTGLANKLYSDVWGYYKVANNANSWLNYLDERYKDDEILYRNHRHYPTNKIIKKLKDIPEWQSMIAWVNREINGATTHAFSLRKITFPTGGTTEYVYEPHRYKDYYQPGQPIITGAGQRIQKIISRAGGNAKPVSTVFKYGVQENGYTNMIHFNWGAAIHNYASKTRSTLAYPLDVPGATTPVTEFIYRTSRTYSSRRPLNSDADSNPPIVYGQVAKYQYDEEGNLLNRNGKTVTYYNELREQPYATAEEHYDEMTYGYVKDYYLGKRAMPDSVCVFDSNNNLVQKETYRYEPGYRYATTFDGVRSIMREYFDDVSFWRNIYEYPDYYIGTSCFEQLHNRVSIAQRLPGSKTTTVYEAGTPVVITETNQYNNRNQRIKTTQTSSQSGSLIKEYKYPDSFTGTVYTEMITKNMVHPVVEQITTHNSVEIGRVKTPYAKDSSRTKGLILPDKAESSASGTANLRTDITYDLYDAKGNLQQFTTLDGKKTTLLWSYNGQYLVAEIQYAAYNEVQSAASALGLNLEALLTTNSPDMTKVNNLRQRLGAAFVTTFTYKPLVGVTSTTDPSGKVTHYDYDSCNRLKEIYIMNGTAKEVTDTYQYNYINQ